jgi:uncharacterized protein YukE
VTNPLVATSSGAQPSPWAGVWIAEDFEAIVNGVSSGSWVDSALGSVGAGLDALAFVSDPIGGLLQYGIAWLIEHVKPLSEALDWLAGDPSQIAAHAQTWRNVANELRTEAEELIRTAHWDVPDWTGAAADAYQNHAANRAKAITTLARAGDAMALMTEGAGLLIGTVRLLVRDAVATVVSRLIVYAGELVATAGLATPVVAEQVSTLCASWAARISRWLKGLISSLRRLGELMTRLERGISELHGERAGAFGGYTGRESEGAGRPHASSPGADLPSHYSPADVDAVASHLDRLDHSPANDAMLARIRESLANGEELTEGQRNFMNHETTEKGLMDQGMPYDDAHERALATHPPGRNYDPEVINEYAHLFNNWWRKQWGLESR